MIFMILIKGWCANVSHRGLQKKLYSVRLRITRLFFWYIQNINWQNVIFTNIQTSCALLECLQLMICFKVPFFKTGSRALDQNRAWFNRDQPEDTATLTSPSVSPIMGDPPTAAPPILDPKDPVTFSYHSAANMARPESSASMICGERRVWNVVSAFLFKYARKFMHGRDLT